MKDIRIYGVFERPWNKQGKRQRNIVYGCKLHSEIQYYVLPLQVNMERIESIDNIKIIQHPGYTQKNKMYFVIFDASVVKANGMIGDKVVYKYDYTVSMKNKDNKLMIDEKLQCCASL